MKTNLHIQLEAIGMKAKEAILYLNILELGKAGASALARRTSIKRSTTYAVLQEMLRKGYIKMTKDSEASYIVREPEKLLQQQQRKRNTFEQHIPDLLKIADQRDNKPHVQYFHGREQLKEYFRHFLDSGEPIYSFLGRQEMDEQLEQYLIDEFIPARVAKGITAQTIVSDPEIHQEYISHDKQYLRETKIVSHNGLITTDEIDLCAPDKVGFFLFAEDEMSAFVIHSQRMYKMMKSLFDIVWNQG